MADFRNNGQTIDRKGDKVILTFRDKESGFSVHGKVVMPAHDFNKALMTIGKHRYHISNLQLVYPSAYGDAREYRGEYKGYKIIVWQKKVPRNSPFFITIRKGKRESHLIGNTLDSSFRSSVNFIDETVKHRKRLVSS
jgi:hypothetical protein